MKKKGWWHVDFHRHWPFSWRPHFVCKWSKDRLTFVVGATCFNKALFFVRAHAWFDSDGRFVKGILR